MKRTKTIGIIAEDNSDIESIKVLINKITGRNVACKSCVGRGSSKIYRKCKSWADLLYGKGCRFLIVVRDSDGSDPSQIHVKLSQALKGCRLLENTVICIPVQELEAWLMADPIAIKKAMNLKKPPNIKSSVELINSPKEHLGRVIKTVSKGSILYVNTIHNQKIAEQISIQKILSSCPSFKTLHDFIKGNL